jgi:alpha-tubulin suppressor-like RCC1 family protein
MCGLDDISQARRPFSLKMSAKRTLALTAVAPVLLLTVLALLRVQSAEGPRAQAAGAVSVSASLDHTCAVTAAGGAKCWGANNFGQLGDGSIMTRTAPVDVTGLDSGVVAISAGEFHTCALMATGGVKCWGGNYKGQLGDGTTSQRTEPVDVLTLTSGVTAIAAGGNHTCARTTAGAAKCWGDNVDSQLGSPAVDDCNAGAPVDPCSKTPQNVTGLSSGVTSVASGRYHTCAVTNSGGVKCWGHNFQGQVGNGSPPAYIGTPVNVTGLTSGVASIELGAFHSCAVTAGGAAKCWGQNIEGQLGDASTTLRNAPVSVSGLAAGVSGISAGRYHTCAALAAGGVKCWGRNDRGQLGAVGTTESCGTPPQPCSTTPLDVQGLAGVKASLAAGWQHSCAVPYSGALQCWGANGVGQLGDGTIMDRPSPTGVSGMVEKDLPTPTATNTPTPPPPCPGDINGDLVVTINDIAEVVGHFGHSEGAGPAKWAAHDDDRRDMNGDASITAGDIAAVVAEFGTVCS